jgi:hypothetical protein
MVPVAMFDMALDISLGLIVVCVLPLCGYIADVIEGRPKFALRIGGRAEGSPCRLRGVVATVGESQSKRNLKYDAL